MVSAMCYLTINQHHCFIDKIRILINFVAECSCITNVLPRQTRSTFQMFHVFCCFEGEMLLYLKCSAKLCHCHRCYAVFVYLCFPVTHVWLPEIIRRTDGSLLATSVVSFGKTVFSSPPQREAWRNRRSEVHWQQILLSISVDYIALLNCNLELD